MGVRNCPYCAEEIKEEAVKCKHCGSIMPELEQKVAKEQIEDQKKQEEIEIKMTASYAKKRLKLSYFYIVLGLVLGGVVSVILKKAIVAKMLIAIVGGNINSVPWFFIPAGIIIGGYCLWSCFWGCHIVHASIKDHYSNLFLFGSSASDLLVKRIMMRVTMYLFVIPFFGLLAGAFGGAIFKHFQFASLARQTDNIEDKSL